MRLEGFKVNIGLFNLLLLVAILSCMDDTFTNNTTANVYFDQRNRCSELYTSSQSGNV